jgi:N6-adenosine-specific RNA methylase IME4
MSNTSLALLGQDALLLYDSACRALAEARRVDEVKTVLDNAVAIKAYAKQAKNRDLEADAVEIRMRATRRLDQLRQAQKETIGLATGGEHGGRAGLGGVRKTPSIVRATLASQGIDKNLAKQARALGALSEERFEETVSRARDAVSRAFKTIVNSTIVEQERAGYSTRTLLGATVADLWALVNSGRRFGVIYADPPWAFRTYSERGKQRSPERHYDCMSLDEIKALPVGQLAARDCALFMWVVGPALFDAYPLFAAWGFDYSKIGFDWVKLNPSGEGLFTGMGYHTRSNSEPCLLSLRGSPTRLAKDVHQVILAPVGRHSEKPREARRRIERLYPGPYLELFGRRPVEGWTVWGNEVSAALTAGEPAHAPPAPPSPKPRAAEPRNPTAPSGPYIGDTRK